MTNYFRITTAYNPNKDILMIVDSNEKFEKIWQISVFLVPKDFQILAVGNESKFSEGNIPKTAKNVNNGKNEKDEIVSSIRL